MAVVLGSTTWPPSDIQQGVPLDSDRPGDSALQRAANAANRAWRDARNFIYAYPRQRQPSGVLSRFELPASTASVALAQWMAHVPEGAITWSLTVRCVVVGTGTAPVQLRQDGSVIATVTATTTNTTTTAFGGVMPGDSLFSITAQTGAGQVLRVSQIWVSWADFT
jgi:hypothetical protein